MYAVLLQAARRSSDVDKDSDSQCSVDLSNADSGRGSNDDGSEQPFRAASPSGVYYTYSYKGAKSETL